jgi:hypothetical protein
MILLPQIPGRRKAAFLFPGTLQALPSLWKNQPQWLFRPETVAI